MNRQLRDQWVDALTSGEFPQTIGQLRRLESGFHEVGVACRPAPEGHCCLGVLAEVCISQWPDKFRWLNVGEGQHSEVDTIVYPGFEDDDYNGAGWVLTGGEMQTSGELMSMGSLLGIHEQETTLIDLNDNGQDFPTIAAWIKTNVPVDDEPLPFAR